MTTVTASAPGKVMITGEYVVLDGAPAICMAVNRRARVSISVAGSGGHRIRAPGFLAGTLRFDSIDDVAAAVPLLAAAWQEHLPAGPTALDIEIDTRPLCSDDRKIGIGSSAAAAVALVAALSSLAGTEDAVLQRSLAAHRRLQSGRGSGADVATCFAGGVIEYRMQESTVQRLSWPKGLHHALLWSGRSSSTPAQLEKLAARAPGRSASGLRHAAADVVSAWRGNDANTILSAAREYTVALRAYDAEHGLGIFAAGHAELVELAEGTAVVYKPCGAGGGDLGIAVAEDEQALRNFVAVAAGREFEPVALDIDPVGVTVEIDSA